MFRLLAIVFVGLGFWLGMRVEQMMFENRCRSAGGTYEAGYCFGAEPP